MVKKGERFGKGWKNLVKKGEKFGKGQNPPYLRRLRRNVERFGNERGKIFPHF